MLEIAKIRGPLLEHCRALQLEAFFGGADSLADAREACLNVVRIAISGPEMGARAGTGVVSYVASNLCDARSLWLALAGGAGSPDGPCDEPSILHEAEVGISLCARVWK